MTFRSFMMIAGAVAVVFGVGFIVVPTLVETVYGMQATPGEAVMGRYFGVTLLGLGLFCWAVKDVTEAASTQKILLATGVSDAIGVLVSLHAALTGAVNALGWFNVPLYAALTAGCAYLYMQKSLTYRAA